MADMSEYIRKVRLASQQNANRAANSLKFRAPTRDTVYDPYRVVKNNIPLDNFKNYSRKGTELFTIDKIITYIAESRLVNEAAQALYKYLNNSSKETYQNVFSRLSTTTIPLSPTQDLILPAFDSSDTATITPPNPLSGKSTTYVMYSGSSIVIPNTPTDISITFDGSKYTYTSGSTTYDLRAGDPIPGLPGVRFKPGSVVLDPISVPFPFPDSNTYKDENNLVWFRGVPLDWVHPELKNITEVFTWSVSTPLPTGLSVDTNTGHIVGMIPEDPSRNTSPGPSIDDISLIGTNSAGNTVSFPFTVKITPDLRIIPNTYAATIDTDGYKRIDSGLTIVAKLDVPLCFNVFDIDPDNPGTSGYDAISQPITWAVLPKLPTGLTMDPTTGEISGTLAKPIDADFRIGVRDQGYPWDSTRARYFTLRNYVNTVPVTSNITIECLTGQSGTFDLKSKIDMSNVRTPYTFATSSTLPTGVRLRNDGVIIWSSPSEDKLGRYPIDVTITDAYNGTMSLSSQIIIDVKTLIRYTPGTYTYTVNSSLTGTIFIDAFVQGAGGMGGGNVNNYGMTAYGGGGGGGAYAEVYEIPVTPGKSINITAGDRPYSLVGGQSSIITIDGNNLIDVSGGYPGGNGYFQQIDNRIYAALGQPGGGGTVNINNIIASNRKTIRGGGYGTMARETSGGPGGESGSAGYQYNTLVDGRGGEGGLNNPEPGYVVLKLYKTS